MIHPVFSKDASLPCTWQPSSDCAGCRIEGRLQCRFDKRDMTRFFMLVMPFFVTAIAGNIRAGYGWALWFWLGYSLFFFFVWEARVLCRHCPFWAEPSSMLRCHANYGVFKIWRYEPGPMSRWEQIQFSIAVLVWVVFPFPTMLLGGQYLLAAITACAVLSGGYLLRSDVCSRCVNFSCPANAVPKDVVDAYLQRNPQMRAAWEARGYQLDLR
jgi:hypothetical protein